MVGYLVLTTLEWMDLQMPRIENDIQKIFNDEENIRYIMLFSVNRTERVGRV